MTDIELLAKRLAFIETCVREIQTLANMERLEDDIRERRFVEHSLQLAIQAVLDCASHIVSSERLGEPATNSEMVRELQRADWIERELAETLQHVVGFRNVLVHGYIAVDVAILTDVACNRLGDLLRFAAAIRAKVGIA